MTNRRRVPVAGLVLSALLIAAEIPPPPPTPKKPVTDDYSGLKITDDYRWLENFSDPEVKTWSDAQNSRSRAYLNTVPLRSAIIDRLKDLYHETSARYSDMRIRGGVLFAMKNQPPKQQPFLVAMTSPEEADRARVIVDPNATDPSGSTTIDFFVPSLDGKLVAVSMSGSGSEEGSVHIFDAATGKELADLIPRVNGATAGGSVAWNADGTGFYYTRYPRVGERPDADLNFYQQVWFHRLGTKTVQDTYALGKEFPRIAEIQLRSSDDGRFVLAAMANGDGGEFLHYVLGPSGRWKQVTRLADRTTLAQFGPDGSLYLVSKNATPMGKILRLAAPDFALTQAKVVVGTGRSSIEEFVPTASRLYVHYMSGGPSLLRMASLDGAPQQPVEIPPISSVGQIVCIKGDVIVFETETYLEPSAWFRFDPAGGGVKKTALAQTSPAKFGDVEVLRRMATSKDGTKVPLNILKKKTAKLDGSNPVLLEGYGGYNISLSPAFSARNRLWIDHGGIVAIANLRGGGEYGDNWHEQGRLTRKQNVFDDFLACADYLIQMKFTTADKLAIEGGSNGGLLMGAALTQRPELFRAVVSHVGIYDMLRVELTPNGAFNVTEFGTVKEPDQFQALYAYSPYHHVKDGIDYPAVLFLTGDHDGRVDPANSRKMTARLQAATHSPRPILLRTSSSSGHGIGTALGERIEQDADVFAFLFDQLEMK